jgi:uncharacterized membrane protein
MILEMDLLLHSIGIAGVLIFFIVLAKLSEQMGEGLRLPRYYRWYYAACIIAVVSIPLHIYLHQNYNDPGLKNDSIDVQGIYVLVLLLSNVIVILVSIKYWGWLKDEILSEK